MTVAKFMKLTALDENMVPTGNEVVVLAGTVKFEIAPAEIVPPIAEAGGLSVPVPPGINLGGRMNHEMREAMKHSYESDVVLGERYRDEQTGYEGIATSITFYQHACERVGIETYDPARLEVKTEVFDSPRLVHVKSGEQATTEKTGGPLPINGQATPPRR